MSTTLQTFLRLAWRNLWRNPRRTLITLIVVSVGLWSVLFFNSLLTAWVQASKSATLGLLLGEGQIHAPGYMDNPNINALMQPPDAALRKALGGPGVSAWAERLVLPAIVQSEYRSLPVMIVGVDPKAERRVSSIPGKVTRGRYLNGPDDDGIILGLHMAERLNTGLGRRVIMMSQGMDGSLAERSFHVVGLYDANQQTEDFYAFTGLRAGQKFLGLKSAIAEIVFTIPKEAALAPTLAALRAAAPKLDVRSWKKLSVFLATTDSFMNGYIYIWLAVVFALMAIGIANTQLMAVFERTREFGLLRALGMKPGLIVLMVSLESAVLIGFGCGIGAVMASLTIWGVHGGIDLSAYAKGLEMFQAGQILFPTYDLRRFLMFSLLIWGLGIVVALWPAIRAARTTPVEAMRHAT